MSLKEVGSNHIESQKELELTVSDYEVAVQFLNQINCEEKAYQETKCELWKYKGVEICLDTWPWLSPLVEVEGKNEEEVKGVCRELGFDCKKAIFDSVDAIYSKVYNMKREIINNKTPRITFQGKNPFINN